jgi:hypothetical protein
MATPATAPDDFKTLRLDHLPNMLEFLRYRR